MWIHPPLDCAVVSNAYDINIMHAHTPFITVADELAWQSLTNPNCLMKENEKNIDSNAKQRLKFVYPSGQRNLRENIWNQRHDYHHSI